MKNITILNFSARNNGNCSAVANALSAEFYNANVRTISISTMYEPCNGCNYECLTPGKICPKLTIQQQETMAIISESDIVYFIIPNYCGVPCANYYAFNERNVGWFAADRTRMELYNKLEKRFIFISNTESQAFELVAKQQYAEAGEVLYLKSGKYKKNSTAGDLMTSDAAKEDLFKFVAKDL